MFKSLYLPNVSAGLIRRELDWRRGKDVPRLSFKNWVITCLTLRIRLSEDLTNELIRRQVRVDPPVEMGRYD